MLNIYYGRECIDKEKFIYEIIAQAGYGPHERTIVIVPDQYTLEAERRAFDILGVQSLIGLDVFSLSRLGHNILAEVGGGRSTFIDKYGRQMLLTSIAREEDENLQVFRGNMAKSSFIELTNDFISEMKQYGATVDTITEIMETTGKDSLLYKKLADLRLIYAKYQEKIEGKYTDSEDLIDLYKDKIGQSALIDGARIWVYGFDSFAPKSLEVLSGFMGAAEEVNVVMTYDQNCPDEDLFRLTGLVIDKLRQGAVSAGCPLGEFSRISDISDGYSIENNADITIVEAANLYNEAETAAAYILHLLRDEGFRYRDIVIICNDQTTRASIISRVFDEYGLEIFRDAKRKILNSNVAIYIVALLETLDHRYRTTDIFKALKTGMTDLTDDEIEALENYSLKYRIKGSMWLKPFEKGAVEYGEEGLAELEALRGRAMAIFTGLADIYNKKQTVSDFARGFYDYLTGPLDIGRGLAAFKEAQIAAGLPDQADATDQIWSMIMGLFDQIVELTGDEPFCGKDFTEILTVGLDQVEVGLLPSTVDDIVMGTMQRTRVGQVKAMIIVGANEGILPAENSGDGLFAVEELEKMAEEGHEICKVDKVRVQEEKLAIDRNLSKPSEHLWISYSVGDEAGGDLRPSDLIDEILTAHPGLQVQRDILNRDDPEELVGGKLSTLRHLTDAMRQEARGEKVDPLWTSVDKWYRQADESEMGRINEAFDFDNAPADLSAGEADVLFKKDETGACVLSPSRIETFAKCPFAHYVTYGLRPEELRVFEVASREIGDVYHACLMKITSRLSSEDRWDSVTEEECRELVAQVLQKEAADYKEGLFGFSNEEKYKSNRMESTCFQALWALVGHVRAGRIDGSRYEVAFGRGRAIPPITVDAGDRTIYIEGKIDRLDQLDNGRVKVIDYKSGNLDLKQKEITSGYRLQLMLYMKAAQMGEKLPAGVFYFHIQDPRINMDKIANKGGADIADVVTAELKKEFKLNGIMVDDEETIHEMDSDFTGASDVIPVRATKNGLTGLPAGSLVTDAEFEELQKAVDSKLDELCVDMVRGGIDIHPMNINDETPCKFCQYKSICRFDLGFDGCRYNMVR
ncbi:PD-(D/E)XK nuclease family protein [Aminicella lysinilytica]|uniref:PD-(D/E)XK nuclease family protein n=1 Tax=Aminicella lysinilytica TaxID=433323 RepID=UPI0026EA1C33|nr:PD-(D/E)XK nuclease family protein [Aminicella lysinilytica]